MRANPKFLNSSAMYIGYQILKMFEKQKTRKLSIYDISKSLKAVGIKGSRQLIIGLSFLFTVGIIDFKESMVWIK